MTIICKLFLFFTLLILSSFADDFETKLRKSWLFTEFIDDSKNFTFNDNFLLKYLAEYKKNDCNSSVVKGIGERIRSLKKTITEIKQEIVADLKKVDPNNCENENGTIETYQTNVLKLLEEFYNDSSKSTKSSTSASIISSHTQDSFKSAKSVQSSISNASGFSTHSEPLPNKLPSIEIKANLGCCSTRPLNMKKMMKTSKSESLPLIRTDNEDSRPFCSSNTKPQRSFVQHRDSIIQYRRQNIKNNECLDVKNISEKILSNEKFKKLQKIESNLEMNRSPELGHSRGIEELIFGIHFSSSNENVFDDQNKTLIELTGGKTVSVDTMENIQYANSIIPEVRLNDEDFTRKDHLTERNFEQSINSNLAYSNNDNFLKENKLDLMNNNKSVELNKSENLQASKTHDIINEDTFSENPTSSYLTKIHPNKTFYLPNEDNFLQNDFSTSQLNPEPQGINQRRERHDVLRTYSCDRSYGLYENKPRSYNSLNHRGLRLSSRTRSIDKISTNKGSGYNLKRSDNLNMLCDEEAAKESAYNDKGDLVSMDRKHENQMKIIEQTRMSSIENQENQENQSIDSISFRKADENTTVSANETPYCFFEENKISKIFERSLNLSFIIEKNIEYQRKKIEILDSIAEKGKKIIKNGKKIQNLKNQLDIFQNLSQCVDTQRYVYFEITNKEHLKIKTVESENIEETFFNFLYEMNKNKQGKIRVDSQNNILEDQTSNKNAMQKFYNKAGNTIKKMKKKIGKSGIFNNKSRDDFFMQTLGITVLPIISDPHNFQKYNTYDEFFCFLNDQMSLNLFDFDLADISKDFGKFLDLNSLHDSKKFQMLLLQKFLLQLQNYFILIREKVICKIQFFIYEDHLYEKFYYIHENSDYIDFETRKIPLILIDSFNNYNELEGAIQFCHYFTIKYLLSLEELRRKSAHFKF